MSVDSFVLGDRFIFRVIKYLSSNPDNKWANSYEFQSTGPGDDVTLSTLADQLILFEQGLHRPYVQFSHVLISTWEPDSKPYNPFVFISYPVVAVGTVPATSDQISLDKALSVARVPTAGRFGHLFFRGGLTEEEVTAPTGKTVLSNPVSIQARLDAALTSSELENYIGVAVEAPLQLVMISTDGSVTRKVKQLSVLGVATVPTDHAWFNRTTTP